MRTAEEIAKVVEEAKTYANGGGTYTGFAREKRIPRSVLYQWLKNEGITNNLKPKGKSNSFVKMESVVSPASAFLSSRNSVSEIKPSRSRARYLSSVL